MMVYLAHYGVLLVGMYSNTMKPLP